MTTHKDKIKTYCERIREARKKATQGEWEYKLKVSPYKDWYEGEVHGNERFDSNGNDGNLFLRSDHCGDMEFIAVAANEILKLCDAVEKMAWIMKTECSCATVECDMCNTLQKVERILE